MKDSENKRVSFLVEDDDPKNGMDATQDGAQNKADKLKKPIICALMAVESFGCMYLTFHPSSDREAVGAAGLKAGGPQATAAGLQSERPSAYAQAMPERPMQEERHPLL